MSVDVGALGRESFFRSTIATSRRGAFPAVGIEELLEAGLLGRREMGATPYAACRVSSVDYGFRKISDMNFGDKQTGPRRKFRPLKMYPAITTEAPVGGSTYM